MGYIRYRNTMAENKRLWGIWHGIKKRCLCTTEPRYKDYGGRGITVCSEWSNGFDAFADWAKANGYEDDLTIERKDVNGNYCPENCEWITLEAQAVNRRNNRRVTYRGETKPLVVWCDELGLKYDATHNRIEKGWTVEDAFEKPLFDQTKSFSRLCASHGLNPSTVRDRVVKLGWTMEDALNTPCAGRGTRILKPGDFGEAVCPICGNRFKKNNGKQRYCGSDCNYAAKRARIKSA